MKKFRNLLLGALLVFSLPSLSACGFFAEEENGYLISDVTTDVDNQGNTIVTISFSSEDKPSVSFTLPKGADGQEGVSIKDVTSEFQEEYNRVKLTITFTDSNKEPFVTYIPVYNGIDGRGIANINVETLENGNQQITISFTDDSSPVSFIVPKGQDGVSIKEITTSYDPISYDVIVTISFTDDSPSVEFRIPRGLRGVSIDYIETQEDENNYKLIIHYDDGTQEEVSFSKEHATNWLYGSTVPDSQNGENGDFYFNLSTGEIYVKENGNWVLKTVIAGVDTPETKNYYYITLDLNGGSLVNPLDPITYKVEEGKYINLPLAYKEGAEFVGWYTDKELTPNSGHVTNITPIYMDMTLYAQYK